MLYEKLWNFIFNVRLPELYLHIGKIWNKSETYKNDTYLIHLEI